VDRIPVISNRLLKELKERGEKGTFVGNQMEKIRAIPSPSSPTYFGGMWGPFPSYAHQLMRALLFFLFSIFLRLNASLSFC
jgi:hypothetical protein